APLLRWSLRSWRKVDWHWPILSKPAAISGVLVSTMPSLELACASAGAAVKAAVAATAAIIIWLRNGILLGSTRRRFAYARRPNPRQRTKLLKLEKKYADRRGRRSREVGGQISPKSKSRGGPTRRCPFDAPASAPPSRLNNHRAVPRSRLPRQRAVGNPRLLLWRAQGLVGLFAIEREAPLVGRAHHHLLTSK